MEITIYVSQHCTACRELIRYLDSKQVSFQQLNIDRSRVHFQEMLRLGGFATPTIVVGQTVLFSFVKEQLDKLLEDMYG
jgi:glutaredoxin